MKRIRAYIILIFTGWHSVKYFGTPKETTGVYLVCLRNNSVMEFNYSNFQDEVRWWKIGIGEEYDKNPIIYWRKLPNVSYL